MRMRNPSRPGEPIRIGMEPKASMVAAALPAGETPEPGSNRRNGNAAPAHNRSTSGRYAVRAASPRRREGRGPGGVNSNPS